MTRFRDLSRLELFELLQSLLCAHSTTRLRSRRDRQDTLIDDLRAALALAEDEAANLPPERFSVGFRAALDAEEGEAAELSEELEGLEGELDEAEHGMLKEETMDDLPTAAQIGAMYLAAGHVPEEDDARLVARIEALEANRRAGRDRAREAHKRFADLEDRATAQATWMVENRERIDALEQKRATDLRGISALVDTVTDLETALPLVVARTDALAARLAALEAHEPEPVAERSGWVATEYQLMRGDKVVGEVMRSEHGWDAAYLPPDDGPDEDQGWHPTLRLAQEAVEAALGKEGT